MNYYQNYHKHTSLSHRYNKDSPLIPKDYFKYYAELANQGIPQIYSTVEHGWQGNYFRIYDDLEKFNKEQLEKNPNYKPIKFIFGTEGYWVKDRFQQDNTNCHIILLAKNDNGRKKINRAIYESYKTGYYYKGRMDLDILLSLPKDDVFVTSACVAFWGYDKNNLNFKETDEVILKLFNHFTDFYLEVQSHNTNFQKRINKHIIELHNKYNIPIISATDSHIITNAQWEDREDLLKSNKISYEDEEGAYMDCPSYEVLVERYKLQGVLTDEEVEMAINNTNKILDFEDIVLDRSLKVPTPKWLKTETQEKRDLIFKDIIKKEWNEQKDDINKDKIDEYKKEIQYNVSEIIKSKMTDYFLTNYYTMKLGQTEKYGGILTPSGRGSGVSFYINKILRFTKVDKINSPVTMYAERFLTATRILESKTPPDIDHNVSDREPFKKAQDEVLGVQGFDLLALGTLHYKSAFKMYSRAYNVEPTIANEVSKQINKYELAIKHAEDDDERELIDIYDYVDKEAYGYLIEGCQQYMGIVDTIKSHPCGYLAYDGDIIEDIGVIMVKSESTKRECFVALQESSTIDAFGYLKQDYLIVDSIGLTYDIYKEIGLEPMSVNELLKKIDNNKKVWDIYAKGYTMCINQAEQPKSTEKVMRYKPKNISELTQWIAGIRPSFQTMYKTFENRQHFDYGIKAFDEIIQDEYCSSSFILYQETLMKVLGFAGFPMTETYTIIKAISKKKQKVIKSAKEKFIPNFSQAIINTKETNSIEVANKMAEKVWKVIENSASYGFNSSHAYCMAIDSVTLAYLKAYYPLEFYKVALQRYTDKGDKDKVGKLKKEMIRMGIKLNPIKFGDDNRTFSINYETNSINQTMSSIKDMQKVVPSIVYELGKKNYKDFNFILKDINKTEINKKSLDILIKLDYFKEYGDINYLLSQVQIYKDTSEILNKIKECKQLRKSDCENLFLTEEAVRECCQSETPKLFKDIDNDKLYKLVLSKYKDIMQEISKKYPYTEATTLDKIHYDIALLGYTELVDSTVDENIYAVENIEVNNYGTVFLNLYAIKFGYTKNVKVNKKWWLECQCEVGDILKCSFNTKNKRVFSNGDWVESPETEEILKVFSIQ